MLQLINSHNEIKLAEQQKQTRNQKPKPNEQQQQVKHKLFMENTKHISNYKWK